MGALAETHGFYGGLHAPHALTEVPNEGGESLMVGDPNEAWVFHILSDGTATGAIWCAQRVPDAHVAVVANMFTIRAVNLTDTRGDAFLFSESMTRVAKARGWWTDGQVFDFTRIYSYGEYYAREYSARRMWRAFSLLNPGLSLQPELDAPLFEKPVYPFSVTPAELVTPRTLMALHRDYYQNTTYDLSQGLAAGPWGLPVRFNPEQAYNGNVTGNWERPMGSFRTGYTVVIQARNYGVGGVLHFAPHASLGSTFVPLFQGALKAPVVLQVPGLDVADIRGVPRSSAALLDDQRRRRRRRRRAAAAADDHLVVDRRSLYWACRYALNIAYARFQDMHSEIAARQDEWEGEAARTVSGLDAMVVAGTGVNATYLHETSSKFVEDVLADWWDLSDTLIRDWSDGFYRETTTGDVSTEYPKWWLRAVGYAKGPPNPTPNVP
jgi:dipeptidase